MAMFDTISSISPCMLPSTQRKQRKKAKHSVERKRMIEDGFEVSGGFPKSSGESFQSLLAIASSKAEGARFRNFLEVCNF